MFSLHGKTTVITGGGRGVGRGITLAMAEAGANVVITGRTPELLEEAAEGARKFGVKAVAIPADITKLADIDRIVKTTVDSFGYIDCWVNNAGSADPKDVGRLIDLDEGQFDRVVDLNLKWNFFCAQAAARQMTRGGSIVNISSRAGSQPCPMTGQYGAAKAGIDSLTATMAVEWGHMNIRVNALGLGLVMTEHSSSAGSPSRQRRQIETTPLRRNGQPSDVGGLCVYLASDEASWISGTVIPVAGGSRIPIGILTYLWKVNRQMEEQEQRAAAGD